MNIAIVICFTNQYYILNGLVLVCLSSELNKELLRIEYKNHYTYIVFPSFS